MFKIHRIITLASLLLATLAAAAQIAPGRTWPELKEAVTERVKAQRYPLNGFDPGEVAQILSRIQSLDRDEWARSWMQSGERMFQAGQAVEVSDRAKAREHYLAAWRYHGFGAWPTQNSPEKKASSCTSHGSIPRLCPVSRSGHRSHSNTV